MSRYYYFASDCVLEEQANPYVRQLSVNQALELGIKVDLDMFGSGFDRNKPNVIVCCENEVKFSYPNIFTIDKDKFYDDIGTTKRFCTALEWMYSADTVDVVFKYMQNHLKVASELELWSVWLGYDEIYTKKKTRCKLDDLTAATLSELFASDLDLYCLTVVR